MSVLFSLFRASLLTVLFLGISVCGEAQCRLKLNELPAAPELFGFRLGMTKEEVKARVPQTVFGRTDDFGVSKTTINPYFDPRIDKSKFDGVRSISLEMLDDHLASLWIGYDETFKVQSIEEFVKEVSQSLQVPSAWSSWKSRGQQLKCEDFQLFVTPIAGAPSLRVVNLAAENSIAQRRQAKEERDSAAPPVTSEGPGPEIVGDKQAKVYYSSACPPAKEISESNKVVFKTNEEAEKAGFKLAKSCH